MRCEEAKARTRGGRGGELAVVVGPVVCSAGLDAGAGAARLRLPCLRRSEIGPACFARDEQRCALCQIQVVARGDKPLRCGEA